MALASLYIQTGSPLSPMLEKIIHTKVACAGLIVKQSLV